MSEILKDAEKNKKLNQSIGLFLWAVDRKHDHEYSELNRILKWKTCCRGTVSMVYWNMHPEYFLSFSSLKDVPDVDRPRWRFVQKLEKMLLSDKLISVVKFDPSPLVGLYDDSKASFVRELPKVVYEVTPGSYDANEIVETLCRDVSGNLSLLNSNEIDVEKSMDLFIEVSNHNFDDGYYALESILRNKNCDLGTASFIYWRASPDYFRRYEKSSDVTRIDREGWDFVHFAESMLLSGRYPKLIRFDPKTETRPGYTDDPSILVRELPPEVYNITQGTIDAADILNGVVGPGVPFAAAAANDVKALENSLKEYDSPNFKYGMWSPLVTAVNNNALDATKYLLENGADIDFKCQDNYRAIHKARTVETVKLLLDHGAKIDLKCTFGTAVHLVAHDRWNGYQDGVLEALIEGGAKPDVKDRDGATALHAAARYGRVKNFNTLLDAGWDLGALDKNGCNVMHHCVDFPGNNFTSMIDRSDMLQELLKLGVSPDEENNKGQSAKALATYNASLNNLGVKEREKILAILEIEQ